MLLLFFLCFQNGYFVDGTEFRLVDGTVIKTLSPVEFTAHTISWQESGHNLVYASQVVREVRYFSIFVPGPPPLRITPTTRQKRIDSQPVFYQADGKTLLRFRHVNASGRSMEDTITFNICREIRVTAFEGGHATELTVQVAAYREGSRMVFSFFDFEGRSILRSMADLTGKAKKEMSEIVLKIDDGLALEACALLEIHTEAVQ